MPDALLLRTQASADERLSRGLCILSLAALIGLCLAWELWLAPTGRGTLAIKVLPLLLPLPGLWRYRMYTFRWLSLMVWLYALEGAVRAPGDTGLASLLGWAEVALSVAVFAACTWHIRLRLAAAKLDPA